MCIRDSAKGFVRKNGLDYLLFVDESHVTLPQVGAMVRGDRARKTSLVDYGFRLPSAFDNRPLSFEEFKERAGQTIFFSATPADYEIEHSTRVVEQVIRPTAVSYTHLDVYKRQVDEAELLFKTLKD